MNELVRFKMVDVGYQGEPRAAELEAKINLAIAELELRMVRRVTTIGFWFLQAVTVALVFSMVSLMR